ncbi:MAG TPA: hypothetical protein VLM85_10075 [Polyangiaceae bacterium]|nr:hypothetical protein [Polyangiaceae bacterium]
MRSRPVRLVLAVCLVACRKDPPPPADAAVSTRPPPSVASPAPSATPPSTPTPTTAEPAPPIATDAGIAGCSRVAGPTPLSVPGPVALAPRLGAVDVVALLGGAPAVLATVPLAGASAVKTASPAPSGRAGAPPCAVAGTFAFCTNPAGELRRFKQLSDQRYESDNFITRPRSGSPIAAAMIGDRPVVAFLRDRTTSEGQTSEAYLVADDGTELRLSDDGAGATSIALVTRGPSAVAVYVDARRAMTPVHARTVTLSPKPALGKDAVLFIAGGAETHTRAEIGVGASGLAFALVPIARDVTFGLGVGKIEGEPRTDAPVTWSDYPNGLDPAPVAATAGGEHVYVARVRPAAAAFGSPRVLEVGAVDDGTFAPLGIVPTRGSPTDVAIANDRAGGFVLAYTDGAGGTVERWACGAKSR